MTELLLDERIMWWVFLPIVYVTFMLSMVRMFYSKYQAYNQTKKPVKSRGTHRDNSEKNIMLKCDMLIKKNYFISKEAFDSRRSFLCKPETGYLVKQREPIENVDPMAQMQGMMDNMSGTLPTIFISIATIGWINYAFGGILLAKVPFNLSQQFKTITQSGIDMQNLNVQYISGMSFYILIMFGLGQIYQLFMKQEDQNLQGPGADKKAAAMRQKMNPAAAANPMMMPGMNPMMPPGQMDPNQQQQQAKDKFKSQIQNLSLVQHHFAFQNCHRSALGKLRGFLAQK